MHLADVLVFAGHKMLGPTGVGVLWARRELLENSPPLFYGGGMVDWVDSQSYQIRDAPHRFEAGTPDVAGVQGLVAAIRYLDKIGWDRITAHDRSLGRFMLDRARERSDYLTVVAAAPAADRGATISLSLNNYDRPDEIASILSDSYGVMCRSGHLCAQPYVDAVSPAGVIRASAYIYNHEAEIESLFDALDEISGRISVSDVAVPASR